MLYFYTAIDLSLIFHLHCFTTAELVGFYVWALKLNKLSEWFSTWGLEPTRNHNKSEGLCERRKYIFAIISGVYIFGCFSKLCIFLLIYCIILPTKDYNVLMHNSKKGKSMQKVF